MEDSLQKILDEIRKTSAHQNLGVFYGYLSGDEERTVHWNEEHGGDWRKFLECAKSLGVRVIYLNWAPFEEFQVEDAITDLDAELSEEAISDSERSQLELRRRQLEKYREKVSLTATIDIAFVAEGVSHIHQILAEWFRDFLELAPGEQEEDLEGEPRPADKASLEKWARDLASNAQYDSHKGYALREYLLEQMAGEEFSKLPVHHILRRAETIYEVELKSQADERLRAQAQELRSRGFTIAAIAHKLGISTHRVSALLAEERKRR